MQFSALAGNAMQRVSSDAVRPYGCGGRYAAAPMRWNCSQTLIRLLRRHLPLRCESIVECEKKMTKGARSEIVKCEKTHQTILRDLPSQSG